MTAFTDITEFDDEVFEQLAALFVGEEIVSELPYGDRLDCAPLNFSVNSLKAVDAYLDVVHNHSDDTVTDQDLLRVVLRAGTYVGEVLRRSATAPIHWVHYDRAPQAIDLYSHGLGRHPATLAVLWSSETGVTLPLGKVFKYLQNGSGDSTHFLAVSMLHRWSVGS